MKFQKKLIFALVIVGSLILVRATLPWAGYHLINWALQNKLESYEGRISDFDLSLYRGAYQLEGLNIIKKPVTKASRSLISIEVIDLSLSWRALIRGELALNLSLLNPEVFLADSSDEEKKQLGTSEPTSNWQDALDVIVPIKIESLEVRRGQLEFINADLDAKDPVLLDLINLDLKEIQTHNTEKLSPFFFKARLQKHAEVESQGQMSFLSTLPDIDVDFSLKEFDVRTVNPTLLKYGPLDVSQGILSIYGEVIAEAQDMTGYAKVFFKDGDIIANKQKFEGFKHIFYEIAVGLGNWILQNSESDSVAAVVPFERRAGEFKIDYSEAFWSALENQGNELKPKVDESLSL